MNTIDHFGKELVLKPINKVRVRAVDKKWNVEYRTKKWIFNIWNVEGQYKDFVDAKAKALALKAQGGIFILQDMKLEWDVGSDEPHQVEEHPPIDDPI